MNTSSYASSSRIENNQITVSAESLNTTTVYVCGSCGNDNEIKPRENIVCKECNGRIFYKKRTKKIAQYEAR